MGKLLTQQCCAKDIAHDGIKNYTIMGTFLHFEWCARISHNVEQLFFRVHDPKEQICPALVDTRIHMVLPQTEFSCMTFFLTLI